MLTPEQIKTINDKFFKDPDWKLVEQIILEHLRPLIDLTKVDTKCSNDEITADVRARQISYENLMDFLIGAGLLKKGAITPKTTFK